MNQIFTGILTAMGNSRTSFIATGIGLVLNIVLDPLFIFGFGAIPPMGVAGGSNCDSSCTAGGYAVVSVYHTKGYGLVQ